MFHFKINKQRKYILIVGAILLFLGLVYRVFPLFQGIFAEGGHITLKQRQLAKYRQIVLGRDNVEAGLISLTRALDRAESGMLTGKTPSLAAVDIQNILNEIAGRSDVEIKTVRVLKPKKLDMEDYTKILVQFTITSEIAQLKEILYGIESSRKHLVVEKAEISVSRKKDSRQIEGKITVSGIMEVHSR